MKKLANFALTAGIGLIIAASPAFAQGGQHMMGGDDQGMMDNGEHTMMGNDHDKGMMNDGDHGKGMMDDRNHGKGMMDDGNHGKGMMGKGHGMNDQDSQ